MKINWVKNPEREGEGGWVNKFKLITYLTSLLAYNRYFTTHTKKKFQKRKKSTSVLFFIVAIFKVRPWPTFVQDSNGKYKPSKVDTKEK